MPETLLLQPEQMSLDTLPQGEALKQVYHDAFEQEVLAAGVEARQAKEGETASSQSFLFGSDVAPDDPAFYRNKLTRDLTDQAIRQSWWTKMPRILEKEGFDISNPDSTRISAKHTLHMRANGEATDQGYDIIEMGTRPVDPQLLEATTRAVRSIDQLTGGLLANSPNRVPIVLLNDVPDAGPDADVPGGFASKDFIMINTSLMMQRMAEGKFNAQQAADMTAVIVAHELLGHHTERVATEGVGTYFNQYFDYSDEKVAGEVHPEIHASIVPKSPEAGATDVVREYGRVNAAEDLATSVEPVAAAVMDLDLSKVERVNTTPDRYRTQLIMGMLGKAAAKAAIYPATPGVVATELRHAVGDAGEFTGFEPVRQFEMESLYGDDAIKSELQRVIKSTPIPKQYTVKFRPGGF